MRKVIMVICNLLMFWAAGATAVENVWTLNNCAPMPGSFWTITSPDKKWELACVPTDQVNVVNGSNGADLAICFEYWDDYSGEEVCTCDIFGSTIDCGVVVKGAGVLTLPSRVRDASGREYSVELPDWTMEGWSKSTAKITKCVIPADYTTYFGCGTSLKCDFEVEKDNPKYYSKDGVLYLREAYRDDSETGDILLQFPASKKGTFAIPDGITKVRQGAFELCALTEFEIGADLAVFESDSEVTKSLKKITIKDNDRFKFINGFLLGDYGETLLLTLHGLMTGEVVVPDCVRRVEDHAMAYISGPTCIDFGMISELTFMGVGLGEVDVKKVILPERVNFYGSIGSFLGNVDIYWSTASDYYSSGFNYLWAEGKLTLHVLKEAGDWSGFEDEDAGACVVKDMDRQMVVSVSLSDYAGGKVTGSGRFRDGSTVTLKATANKGYVFSYWEGPLGDATDPRSPTVSYVVGEEDAQFIAHFIPVADDAAAISFEMADEYAAEAAIAPVAIDASKCTSLPKVTVKGLPSGLKFTAKDVYKKGSKTEVEYPANTIYGTPTKSGVYTVVATVTTAGKKAAAWSQTVIVRKSGENVVVVECDANCGKVKGAGVYAAGKKVTLKATPNKGYVFAGWYEDEAFTTPCDSTIVDYRTASYSYTMGTDDKTFYARFIPALEDSVINLKVNEKSVPTTFTVPKDVPLSIDVDSLSLPKISVKGLPAGMKFTAKPIYKKGSKTEIEVPANTIYGAPTKPGNVEIQVSLSNQSIKKAIVKKFIIEVPNLTGANGCFANDLDNGAGKKRVLSVGITNIDDFLPSLKLKSNTAKLAVSGLPSGLKYDAKTGKITGIATKPGSYTVYLTVTEGKNKYVSTITVEVYALPDWAVGTFSSGDGWYYADVKGPTPWYGEAGYDFVFNLSVDSKGKLSGSLMVDVIAGKQEKATFSASGAVGFIESCHLEYWHDWQHGIGWRPECEYNGPAYYYDVDIKLHGVVQKRRLYICDASYGNRLEEGVPEPTVEGMGIAIFANAKLREGREDPEFLFEGTASMNLWKNKAYSGSLPKFASSTIKLQTISEGGSLCDLVIKQSGVVAITILKDNGVKDSASTDLEIYTINSDGSFHVIGNWIFQRGSASDIEMIFRPNKNGIITADDIEIIDLDVDDDPNWDED